MPRPSRAIEDLVQIYCIIEWCRMFKGMTVAEAARELSKETLELEVGGPTRLSAPRLQAIYDKGREAVRNQDKEWLARVPAEVDAAIQNRTIAEELDTGAFEKRVHARLRKRKSRN